MKRATWLGTGISALSARPSPLRFSFSAIAKPRFGMNGNGCAGSTASGVSSGNTSAMNSGFSQVALGVGQFFRLEHGDAGAAQFAAQDAPALLLALDQVGARRRGRGSAVRLGVSPSWLSIDAPAFTCSCRPATRTM